MSNEPRRDLENEVESLVRAHLQQRASQVDPRPLFERIRASAGPETGRPVPPSRPVAARRRFARLLWSLSAAAAVLVALVVGVFLSEDRASAQTLLLQARRVHAMPVERSYLVDIDRAADDELTLFGERARTCVMTRGDRFWVEWTREEQRWTWGRDEAGTFWMSLGPHRGMRIAADEAGPSLVRIGDIYSLQVDTLLGNLLREFDLHREPSSDPAVRTVRAEPRPGAEPAWLRRAVLEIDGETKVLRRLVLSKVWPKKAVTVTFTLIDTTAGDETKYQIEGHLTAPYRIFDAASKPDMRREVLVRWFGPWAERWFLRAPEK
jgi:hypothetical protein